MALSLIAPLTSGLCGPGYMVQVYNDAIGPIPIDDWVEAWMHDPANSTMRLTSGTYPSGGSRSVSVMLGRRTRSIQAGRFDQHAAGFNAKITAVWYHDNGAAVDSIISAGTYTWDPVGGLGELIGLTSSGVYSNTTLSEILAAVKKTLPRTN
jgi:hypothetical protein